MQQPLQIVFRNIPESEAVSARIRERVARLNRLCADVVSCRVAIELGDKHHHQGGLYHVRVDLKVPDAELVSSRAPDQHHAHEDAHVAVRDAFDALERQLLEHLRKRSGEVKHHEVPPHGRISELHDDHGRIETSDGRSVYFHRNSVLDAEFDELAVGAEVWFAEERGELGPQASSVHVLGKHHIAG